MTPRYAKVLKKLASRRARIPRGTAELAGGEPEELAGGEPEELAGGEPEELAGGEPEELVSLSCLRVVHEVDLQNALLRMDVRS